MARWAPAEERFWARIDKREDGCWDWIGAAANGYGVLHVDGRYTYAYRFAYELLKGPIPAAREPDHLCRNKRCVNPDHLELVTRTVNFLRGSHPNAVIARSGRCKWGHPFVRYRSHTGRCRECNRLRAVADRARLRGTSLVQGAWAL